MTLEIDYKIRFENALCRIAPELEQHLNSILINELRIDRISVRPKSVQRFVEKSQKTIDGKMKYNDPINQIQDQIGARIITFYKSDIERLKSTIEKYYRLVESRTIVPESEWEFGYFGQHYILLLPKDVIDNDIDKNLIPDFFELQIKTLFQHAWSEANHDLGYKPGMGPLNTEETRRLAFTAAQAWGADQIFDELFKQKGIT